MEIGEDGERSGFIGGGGDERCERRDEFVEAREDISVEVARAVGAVFFADEIEEDVLAEVEEARVVELEAAVFLVVGAVFGGNRGDVGDDRAVPRALPAEAKRGEERHGGLPRDGFFKCIPRGEEGGGARRADEALGATEQNVADRRFWEKLRGADRLGVGPVGRARGVADATDGADAGDAGVAHGEEFLVQRVRERHAEHRLLVHHGARGIVEHGLNALRARLLQRHRLVGRHRGVEDRAAGAGLLRVARVAVGRVVALDHERRRFPAHVTAERGLDVVVLDLEGLDAEEDVEIGIHLGGGDLEIFEEASDARTRGGGDLVVVAPLADHVGTAVAADVERGAVFEAGAAVVREERHMAEVRHGVHELADRGAEMLDRDRVVLRERVAR